MNDMEVRSIKSQAQKKAESLMLRFQEMYGVDHQRLYDSLLAQFSDAQGNCPNAEEMVAIMVTAEQYGLNPFTKEIYAFRGKNGRYTPMVSVDGWCKIVTRQPTFDGVEFSYSQNTSEVNGVSAPESCTCAIYRRGLSRPIMVTEYFEEVFMPKSPVWNSMPRRMLRHRAYIQCARLAFGITGIGDADDLNGFGDGGALVNVPIAQTQSAVIGTSSAAPVGYQPAQPANFGSPVAASAEPQPVQAPQVDLQQRFATLMQSRQKLGDSFWDRAERSITRDGNTTPEQKEWLKQQLSAARAAEQASQPEPEVVEPPAAKAAEPQPKDDDLDF